MSERFGGEGCVITIGEGYECLILWLDMYLIVMEFVEKALGESRTKGEPNEQMTNKVVKVTKTLKVKETKRSKSQSSNRSAKKN